MSPLLTVRAEDQGVGEGTGETGEKIRTPRTQVVTEGRNRGGLYHSPAGVPGPWGSLRPGAITEEFI